VGRLPAGKALFVPGTLPGERVRVRLVEEKASFARGVVVELLETAPERVRPRCPAAGSCGGCSWQHVALEAQRDWKRRLLTGELLRHGVLSAGEAVAPVAGGEGFGHRTRTRLHRRAARFGTMVRRSHQVIPLEACPVLAPELERFALEVGRALRQEAHADADLELYVDARGARGLYVEPSGRVDWRPWERVATRTDVRALRFRGHLTGPGVGDALEEDSLGMPLFFEPGVFVQTNRAMNARLVSETLRAAGQGGSFAEVYAGAGNLTLHLVEGFARGVVSEENPASAAWLERNLQGSGAHLEVRAEADSLTCQVLCSRPPVEVLVVDPPRAGIRPLYPLFQAAPPHRVVMASCHPMAAVRDLGVLVREHGYRLESLVAIDLFPQTDHLELVATLVREAGDVTAGGAR
jgi:23S rRNA (uracil1939-C5)-methyltransferase